MTRYISAFIVHTVDITVYHNGFHGDLNETFFVGDVDEEAKKLVQTTYECLMQAIDSGRNALRCSLYNYHHGVFTPFGCCVRGLGLTQLGLTQSTLTLIPTGNVSLQRCAPFHLETKLLSGVLSTRWRWLRMVEWFIFTLLK